VLQLISAGFPDVKCSVIGSITELEVKQLPPILSRMKRQDRAYYPPVNWPPFNPKGIRRPFDPQQVVAPVCWKGSHPTLLLTEEASRWRQRE
jgi:hypothetical protein